MTLEEAVRELSPEMENLRRKSLDYPQTTYLGAKDARLLSALATVTSAARAFPKMLETLNRAEWSGIQHHSGASCCPFCGATMGSGVHGSHCAMDDALRAAREAVKP